MSKPTARELELAASVNLGADNWTEEIARLLAAYRAELRPNRIYCVRCGVDTAGHPKQHYWCCAARPR
jgi:hypothetical protein